MVQKLKEVASRISIIDLLKAGWVFALIVLQLAAIYYGLKMSDQKTIQKIELMALEDSLRTVRVEQKIGRVDEKLDRRTEQINTELQLISKRTGYIARKVD